jgi:hypothetical protein
MRLICKWLNTEATRLIVLGGAIVLALLAVACGSDGKAAGTPTPQPTPIELVDGDEADISGDFDGSRPPDLIVTAEDSSVTAGLGSFCYANLCADTIGYITPAEVLRLDGDSFSAMLESESIVELSVSATPEDALESQPVCTVVDGIEPTGPICDSDQDQVAWTGAFDAGGELQASIDGSSINVDVSPLEMGRYVVSLFVRFETGGDASYGVLLDVA